MRNAEKDAIQMAENKRRILEGGFRLFAACGIEEITMPQIAEAGGVDRSSVYRYYPTKLDLVVAISANVWENFAQQSYARAGKQASTAAQRYAFMLDSFLDLYRNHSDMLRFNQFFNVYVANESGSNEKLTPFTRVIDELESRFHEVYTLAKTDGTLRTEVPENEMFSTTLHLMLAAATRYAVGLVYKGGTDPEKELEALKEMLMQRYTNTPKEQEGT
ncbi:MAG: TetR/AcrR family transcriptional regulator [Clostridia bacterium]|nr:TetR/AcrR family transcriptional regulator [Clostridia bacterium]